MKFIVLKSNIKEALGVVERATGENQNLAILKNVLLEALSENKIQLTATNLELAIRCVVGGKVLEEGRASVHAGVLSNLVGNLPSDRLNVETRGHDLFITTDSYEGTLKGLAPDDYPIIPKVKNATEYIETKGDVLKQALLQTSSAAQVSEIRPELSSVLLEYTIEQLKLAATDSFRLAEKVIPQSQFESNIKSEFKILIPLKTAQEVARITLPDERVRLSRDENQVLFQSERYECISRLTEGNFPEYSSIVPKEFACEIIADVAELSNALKITSVTGGKGNEVKVRIHKNKKAVEMFSADNVVGENTYVLPAKIKGEVPETTFNWRFLNDGLKSIEGSEVFFGINGEKPAVLKSAKNTPYFYLLAPILH